MARGKHDWNFDELQGVMKQTDFLRFDANLSDVHCRLVELIVLNVGLNAGILSQVSLYFDCW